MKRIGNSKEPTVQRMLNMVSNLRDKFDTSAFINLNTHSFDLPHSESVEYWISMSDRNVGEYVETWPELLARYRELMND